MRLESFFASPVSLDKKFLVPDFAIVPRFSCKSFLLIPIPESVIVSEGFSPSVKVISTLGSKSKDFILESVKVVYLNLSKASDAFDINSLKKISFENIMNG